MIKINMLIIDNLPFNLAFFENIYEKKMNLNTLFCNNLFPQALQKLIPRMVLTYPL